MPNKQTLKWIASLSASLVVALVLADACVAPADRDIHSSGAIAIRVSMAFSEGPVFGSIKPSQSLAEIRCQVFQRNGRQTCPDDTVLALNLWPRLKQTPKTLYVGLPSSCDPYTWVTGFNVEYFRSNRTLVFHCHVAAPWISIPTSARGMMTIISTDLVLVSTDAIPGGRLTVVQDDRIEHLIGDQTTETALGTVTIS